MKIKENWKRYMPLLFFLVSTIIRGLLSDYPKKAVTYRDELYYLGIAKDLWNNGTITVYKGAVDFSKILYSIVLAPFFSISNGALRVSLISWFNAALVSSAVFPAWLIGKKIVNNRILIIVVAVFLAGADMCYSMTFMAENLFLPMGLWGILIIISDLNCNRVSILKSLLIGVYIYLLYLCKEAGGAIVISFLILRIVLLIIKNNKKNTAVALIMNVAAFITVYMVGKLSVFRNMAYSYSNQVSLSSLVNVQQLAYFLHGLLINLLYILIQWHGFLILIPMVCIRRMDSSTKLLFIFSALTVLITAIGISFGVTLHENTGFNQMRIHTRYYIAYYFPLMLCFAKICSQRTELSDKEKKKLVLWSAMLILLIIITVYPPKFGSAVDALTLEYARRINNYVFFRIGICFIWVILLLIGIKKTTRQLFAAVLSILFVASIINNVMFMRLYIPVSVINKNELAIVQEIDEAISDLDADVLVVVGERKAPRGFYQASEKIFDTYTTGSYYKVCVDDIVLALDRNDGRINLNTDHISSAFDLGERRWGYDGIDVGYILFLDDAYKRSNLSNRTLEDTMSIDYPHIKLMKLQDGVLEEIEK